MKSLLSYPWIHEYDLKGAFPSVDIRFVYDTMKSVGFPEEIAKYFTWQALGTVETKNPIHGDLIPEPKRRAQEAEMSDANKAAMELVLKVLGKPLEAPIAPTPQAAMHVFNPQSA
jgi:hypothetical protein